MMERVYDALKLEILAGIRASGQRLDPARLAPELHASTTPVRDALHRLVGERLVANWPQEGFHVPIRTEPGLRDLYAWNLDLMRLVLGTARGRPLVEPPRLEPGGQDGEAIAELFSRLGQLSPNFEHRNAIASINDRLAPARRIEILLFDDHAAEFAQLDASLTEGDRAQLQHHLIRYHRRRIGAVPDIVARLRPAS